MRGKSVLLIIGGGIAAYKSLELVRRLSERGVRTRAILTRAGAEFVTPLSVASLTGEPVDPVRFLANHCSGKQGYAIAEALMRAGAETTLVSGPASISRAVVT